jgi:DNA-3-methyladenine glycosylase
VRLPRSFYAAPTLLVAENLLGKILVHRTAAGVASGMIVEAEAYIGEDDPACHAAPGPTRRNQPLYGPPGFAYVYLNYGVHSLFNVVTEAEGRPAAVLIRALEPLDGLELMRARRMRDPGDRPIPAHELCRGPGNLTRALDIRLTDNRADLCAGGLYLEDRGRDVGPIAWSPRIGITLGREHRWRCYAASSRAVSGQLRSPRAR